MKRGLICEGKGGLSGFGRRCTCPQTKQCFALQNTQYIGLEITVVVVAVVMMQSILILISLVILIPLNCEFS